MHNHMICISQLNIQPEIRTYLTLNYILPNSLHFNRYMILRSRSKYKYNLNLDIKTV